MKKRRCINPDTVVMLKQIAIGVLVLTTVALLVTATWYGTRVKFLTIQEVMVEGGQTISTVEIEKKVQAALEGQYLRLVPRRFAWLYPEAEVLEIVKSVERVHDVKTEVIKGIKLSVTFDEYIPLSLWCDSVVSYNCLFIDEKGYAFGRAPKLSGGTFLRFVSTDRNIEIGQTLSGQEIFDNSLRMAALLKDESWFVSHIELDKVGDVFFGMVGGSELKTVASKDAQETIDNLLVVLASEEFAHLKPGNFQYIDLRFGNKVFVNEELAVPEEEAASEEVATTTEREVSLPE